jgi:hypothetical protein
LSFLSSTFSGGTNQFTPMGTQDAIQRSASSYQAYGNTDKGLRDLIAQLQQQANGQGPSVSNQLLQNATAQNVAQQAALQAGQRGAASNVGLMARQIGQQGAGIQQQAVGQAAANRLQEQIAARQQIGGLLGTEGQLANQMYGINQGTLTSNNQLGGQIAAQNAQNNAGLNAGLAGAGLKAVGLGFADGGQVPQLPQQPSFLQNFASGMKPQPLPQGLQMKSLKFAQGGQALPFAPMDMEEGGPVQARGPQEQATKAGNSYANDKIPAMLSEKEVVLPREVTQSGNPPQAAAQFMAQVMAGKHRVKK